MAFVYYPHRNRWIFVCTCVHSNRRKLILCNSHSTTKCSKNVRNNPDDLKQKEKKKKGKTTSQFAHNVLDRFRSQRCTKDFLSFYSRTIGSRSEQISHADASKMRQAFFFTAIKFTYDSRATTLSSFTRFNRGDLCTWTLHLSVQSSIYGGHCCCISRCSRGSRRKRDGGVAHLPPTFGRLTRCSGILVNHNGPRMSLKNSWDQPGRIHRSEISPRSSILFFLVSINVQ